MTRKVFAQFKLNEQCIIALVLNLHITICLFFAVAAMVYHGRIREKIIDFKK